MNTPRAPGARASAGLAGLAAALLLTREASAQRAIVRPPVEAGVYAVDEVVIAIEAAVEDPVPVFVLAHEVLLSLRLEQALTAAPEAATRVSATSSEWRDAEELVAGEALLERAAKRSADPEPTPEELFAERAWLERTTAASGGPEALCASAGLPPSEFDRMVRRRIVAARFLLSREGARIEPADEDLRAEWRRGEFRGESFSSARGAVRALLIRRGYARAVRGYLRGLGTRLRMRRAPNPLAAEPVDDVRPSAPVAQERPEDSAGADR